MATFADCIELAVNAGKISKDVAERLRAAPDPDAELTNIVAKLSRQKRETVIQAVRLSDAWKNAASWEGRSIFNTTHKADPLSGIQALLSRDIQGVAKYSNVELTTKAYQSQYHSAFVDAMQHFRTRALGWSQNEADLQKLVRAIYGEDVGDPQIMRFAKDWAELNERMRQDFNARGGSISKNERYLMPQHHDARAVLALGKTGRLSKPDLDLALREWKRRITPQLDLTQMVDDAGNQLSPEALDETLDYVFESIITNGANKTKDLSSVPAMGGKLSRRHSERRFLYFKDADSWLQYQKDFGRGDIFSTLTGHIDTMAHEIALMEVLGPNPEATYKALMNQAAKEMRGLDPVRKSYTNKLYNVVSGKVNGGEMLGFADASNTMTNILVASTLGSAFLSAISDVGFQLVTSVYRGLPAFRSMGKQLQLMTSEEAQVFAAKMGLMADGMIGRMHAANRYADVYGTGLSSKVAESVMRGSLLEPWTNAGRWGFGMSMSQEFASNFGKRFDELSDAMRKGFDEYGIEAADWDAFRATATSNHRGLEYANLTHPEAKKFAMMVHGETDFAVPTPDARVRAITTGGKERATIGGQSWRAVMMLKSFPIGIFMTHFQRAAYQSTTGGRLAYMGAIAATATVLGGLALQMKDIAAGRDPREMFDDEGLPIIDDAFLGAAFMQGGGLGIFGDLVFSDYTRFGQTLTETAAGPKLGMINDTAKLFQLSAGGIRDAVASGQTNVLGDFVQYLDRYTPDTWQTRLFTNALFDQLELLADPKAAQKFNRQTRARRNEFDQEYWWKPGELTPERAPDLTRIFEE